MKRRSLITPWVFGVKVLTIAGGVLYSSLPAPTLEYVSNDVGSERFTALFGRAVATELAARLVMPLLNDRARQGDLARQAEMAKQRAVADDLNRNKRTDLEFASDRALSRGVGIYGGERQWGWG